MKVKNCCYKACKAYKSTTSLLFVRPLLSIITEIGNFCGHVPCQVEHIPKQVSSRKSIADVLIAPNSSELVTALLSCTVR